MGLDVPWHWVVLAIVVIALFGYKKLPDAARSLGRSLRIFKTEIKGMSDDDKVRDAARDATLANPPSPITLASPVAPSTPVTPGSPVAPSSNAGITAANPVAPATPTPAAVVVPADPQRPESIPASNGDKPAGSDH